MKSFSSTMTENKSENVDIKHVSVHSKQISLSHSSHSLAIRFLIYNNYKGRKTSDIF